MCDDLSDENDIKSKKKSLCGRSNILLRTFYFCSKKVKDKLFSSYCSNVYLCSLWANYRKAAMQHFIASYNNAFKIMHSLSMMCSASLMLLVLAITVGNTRFRKCVSSLTCRIFPSTNNIVQSIEYNDMYDTSVLRIKWIRAICTLL